jgi:hypothetical protein
MWTGVHISLQRSTKMWTCVHILEIFVDWCPHFNGIWPFQIFAVPLQRLPRGWAQTKVITLKSKS